MAPSFDITPPILDFGKVSYSFPKTERVILHNTSTVPFKFNLRIPGDGKLN
jgi:hydrocephalus-inducing protein